MDGSVTLSVRRPMDTSPDTEDYVFTMDSTVEMVWALNDTTADISVA